MLSNNHKLCYKIRCIQNEIMLGENYGYCIHPQMSIHAARIGLSIHTSSHTNINEVHYFLQHFLYNEDIFFWKKSHGDKPGKKYYCLKANGGNNRSCHSCWMHIILQSQLNQNSSSIKVLVVWIWILYTAARFL